MNRFRTALIVMSFFSAGNALQAFPEFAGDGYFSCTSCHVSSSGGDVVTAYGRSFAEEKLAWSAYEGEAMPLHSAKATPSWLLLGGHSRWIQIHYEDEKSKEGRFFNMQRSLDFGVQHAGFFTYLTVTQERENTWDYKKDSLLLERFLVRYDVLESLSVRYGLLTPKFGLNVVDHNAYVRSKAGFGPGSEEGLTEVTWFSEYIEVNLSHSTSVPSNDRYIPHEKSETNNHTYFNSSVFLAEKHRISLSGLQRKTKESMQTGADLSSVLTLGETFRYAAEASQLKTDTNGDVSTTSSLYSQLTLWTVKGVYPGLRYEQYTEKSDLSLGRGDKIALNLTVHPRPHFEFSGSLGLRRDLEAFSYGHTGFLMFHYWL
jgi:hypothetical protein